MNIGISKNAIGLTLITIGYLSTVALTKSAYSQLILTLVPIWALFAISWNILGGYAGLISFGHAVFFGIGAYSTAILFAQFGISPIIGIGVSGLIATVAALLIGMITFRLRGHYFTLAMLAFPMALLYIVEWSGRQELALPLIDLNPNWYLQFKDPRIQSIICFAMLAFGILVSLAIESSRFGLALQAIRQNESAAEASGISAYRWKLYAIAVSGFVAGIAGGLYAIVLLVVTPGSVFGMLVSAYALILTMFGGSGRVWGPVVGAAVLVPLTEVLHAQLGSWLPGIQGVILGIAIVIVIVAMPNGVFNAARDLAISRRKVVPEPYSAQFSGAVSPAFHALDGLRSVDSSPDGEALLAVNGVSIYFGGVSALNNVDITIRSREMLGIIGPNGAGKTTLMNAINGFSPLADGNVKFRGLRIDGMKPSAICALGVARTFQTVRSFPELTTLENIKVGSLVAATKDAIAGERAQQMLQVVGMQSKASAPADQLTNFELRMVELARAMATVPILILMDEPFAGLSSVEIVRMSKILRAINSKGITIAIVDHTVPALKELVDRFVVLDHGSILAEGKPAEVLASAPVIEAYLGRGWKANAAS